VSFKFFHIFIFICLLFAFQSYAQKKSNGMLKDTIVDNNYIYNPLSPAKAAFYSAILPGLGQAYNKKYWKIPFVYAALGSGIYFYSANNTNYNRVREAYKHRIADKPDEFDGTNGNPFLTKDALISAQKSYRKDRDLSLLVTVGLYVLQIVEASTNAHLLQYNVDNKLSVNPKLIKRFNSNKTIVGAQINFKF